MPPEIQALFAEPQWLVAVLAVGAVVGMAIERILARIRRRAWKKKKRKDRYRDTLVAGPWSASHAPPAPKQVDAADQLRKVMTADFTPQPLLNRGEARLFQELEPVVASCNPTWRVMAQVSLGEILGSDDGEAYRCINSKRVDLLLIDGDFQPRHAIEYQGLGHHQADAAARDAVKKEALRRAGVGYHEVIAGHTTPADLRRLIEKLVDKPGRLAS